MSRPFKSELHEMRCLFAPCFLFTALVALAVPSSAQSDVISSPSVPDEAWADRQTEIALGQIDARELARAQSLFDDGWSPFFGFPPVSIYAGQVATFDWRTSAWRRANLDEYLAGTPDWQPMFDLSKIPSDGSPFMVRPWANLNCVGGFANRCMIAVTQGGFDEIRWLEIDGGTGTVPDDGFDIPVARASVAWLDKDTLLVAIGLDENDTGPTAYPLTVRLLRRGSSLVEAPIIYRAEESINSVSVYAPGNAASQYAIINATSGTRSADTKFVDQTGAIISSPVPVDASPLGVLDDFALLVLLEDWTRDQRVWQAGSVVAFNLKETRDLELVLDSSQQQWALDPTSSIGALFTSEAAYLAVLEEGVQSVVRAHRRGTNWDVERLVGGGQRVAALVSADPAGTALLASTETALEAPTLLQLNSSGLMAEIQKGKQLFESQGLTIKRLSAKAEDGVPIPYWHIASAVPSASHAVPTILHGYGASNVPLLPEYAGDVGRMWLERGGAYVVAQIRGGGEYGSNWYNAGHGENRGVPVRDFIAIAEDLIARGLASSDRLGIDGLSDGGRLVAGAGLARPDLFSAVVSRDGSVYPEASSAAGSPILAEDLALLETAQGTELANSYWPERIFDPELGCAPILFTTWRGDQRVAASQSRALARKLKQAGCDVLLMEQPNGDHGSVNAELIAAVYSYLRRKLGFEVPASTN
ncbi:MAG: prolyl oligopeptidase family serine peptidase [Pseudomonadota bacterium]